MSAYGNTIAQMHFLHEEKPENIKEVKKAVKSPEKDTVFPPRNSHLPALR